MRIALFNSINVNYFVDHAVRLSRLLAKIALVAVGIFSALALGVYLYRHYPLNIVTTEDLGNDRLKKTYRNGIIEEGFFFNGKLEGEGKRLFPGDIGAQKVGPKMMEGTFKDGKLNGPGNIRFIDGKEFAGTFAEGSLIQGKKVYPLNFFESSENESVSPYEFWTEEGTFVHDLLNGQGTRSLRDGSVISGDFRKGQLRPPADFSVKIRTITGGDDKTCSISLKEPISVLYEQIDKPPELCWIIFAGTQLNPNKTFAECMDELKCEIEQGSVFHIVFRLSNK